MKRITLLFFVTAITSIFIFPSSVFAVWWNPNTWIKRDAPPSLNTSPVAPKETNFQESQLATSSEPEIQVVEKVIEKPIERIVTKTIPDPTQAQEIKRLTEENLNLKKQLQSASILQSTSEDTTKTINRLTTDLENVARERDSLKKKLNELKNKLADTIEEKNSSTQQLSTGQIDSGFFTLLFEMVGEGKGARDFCNLPYQDRENGRQYAGSPLLSKSSVFDKACVEYRARNSYMGPG